MLRPNGVVGDASRVRFKLMQGHAGSVQLPDQKRSPCARGRTTQIIKHVRARPTLVRRAGHLTTHTHFYVPNGNNWFRKKREKKKRAIQ